MELIMSGAVMVMVIMDAVVVDGCVVCGDVLCALFSTRYLHILAFAGFFVVRFCEQILLSDFCPQTFSSTFIKPSAKPTSARVLGIN
jgi:hypothetical protein